jgi:ABC-type glutathione transport system ATPase component
MDPRTGEVAGINIISLNPEFVSQYINETLKSNLRHNNIQFERDWQKMTNAEGVDILRAVEGLDRDALGGVSALETGYVLTVDNVLKMLSIQMRLKLGLPVIIMGETGCGKSTLIRNLCAVLGCPLKTLNVHGGMEDTDIIAWMTKQISAAEKMRSCSRIIVFLDEVNTCNSMGLFKEIVCDRTMNGILIPDKIQIIAACNPYRLRTGKNLYGGEEMAGLIFEHFSQGPSLENVGKSS